MIGSCLILLCIILLCLSNPKEEPPSSGGFKLVSPLPSVTEVNFIPNWFPEAEFAGYFLAKNIGYYDKLNLNVNILPFDPDYDIPCSLATGAVDFAVMGMTKFIQAIQQNRDIVALAALFQIEPSVFISKKKSKIRSPADFKGKSIICKNDEWFAIIERVVSSCDISIDDIILVQDVDDISRFYRDEIDIWTGYIQDEPVEIEMAGIEANYIYAFDYGINDYEGIIVVDGELARNRPEVVVAFLSASLHGWDTAIKNTEDAIDAILNFHPGLSRSFQRKSMKKIVPFIRSGDNPIGWIDRERWNKLIEGYITDRDSLYASGFIEEIYYNPINR